MYSILENYRAVFSGQWWNPERIRRMQLMLTARMHAAILATGMGVPAIGLAYNQKFGGFFSLIGREDAVIPLDHLVAANDAESLVLRMSQMLQTRDNVTSAVSELRNTLTQFNESLFNGR